MPAGPVRGLVDGQHPVAFDDRAAADQEQLKRRRRPEDQRRDRVSDARVRGTVEPPQRDVGQLARLQRADLAPRGPAAGRRRAWPAPAPAGRSSPAGRPPPWPAAPPAVASPISELPSLEAAPSTPRPTGTPAASSARGPADARAEPGVGGRAVRHPGAGRRRAGRSPPRPGGPRAPARRPSPSQPERVQVLDRRAAEPLRAVLVLVGGLGQVGVQPDAPAPGQLGRLGQQLAGDRERRARRDAQPQHRARRRVMELLERRLGGGQDLVPALDHVVGRQPALADGPGPSTRGSDGTAAPPRAAASTVAPSTSPPPRGNT